MPSVASCLKIVKMNIAEIIREFAGRVTILEVIIFLIWLFFLGGWLVKTSWGRNALVGSPTRRNNMPFYLPFIPLFIWYVTFSLSVLIAGSILPDLPDWQSAFVNNLLLGIGGLTATIVIIFLARNHFAGRLKGFGLNPRVIHKDFGAALLNLFFVWPLLVIAIILTTLVGKVIWGQDFHIQQHEELELITTYSQLSLRILIFIIAAVIAPVLEEALFRGMFQTMIRSSVGRPWLSVAISSAVFAMIHPNPAHWPALFVLAVCLGYSYEKSGSLFRPIFIHSIFNTTSIIAALYSV